MQTIYNDPTYTKEVLINKGPYNTTITQNAVAGVRSEVEALHNRLNSNSLMYEGVCIGTIKLIIYATGEDAVVSIKQRYIGFGDTAPQEMMHHLRTNVCVRMNTMEKEAFKSQGYAREWDAKVNINTYFKELEDFEEKLEPQGIATFM